jgi:hypothetical protein
VSCSLSGDAEPAAAVPFEFNYRRVCEWQVAAIIDKVAKRFEAVVDIVIVGHVVVIVVVWRG